MSERITTGGREAVDTDREVDWARYHAVTARLLGRPMLPSRLDWWGPVGFALLGLVLRLWQLGRPPSMVFDESYYVKQAYSMSEYGVELRNNPDLGKKVDSLFVSGTHDVFTANGDLVLHPPLGKWLIALGQMGFGVDHTWAWRIVPVLFGAALIVIVGRAARRLTRSAFWGTIAAGLATFEATSFVVSRTGILDIFVVFFAFAAFACLLVDRDVSRERLAWLTASNPVVAAGTYGPSLGPRWWRLGAGVLLGLCTSTKWSGAVFLAVFGLLTVFWDMNARRLAGYSGWFASALGKDAGPAFIQMVGTTLVLYLVSWTGWFASSLGYGRRWADSHPATGLGQLVPGPLRSLMQYHAEMWKVSTGITVEHPYATQPWSWFLQIRPTLFYKVNYSAGAKECGGEGSEACLRTITSLGTAPLWWAGLAAVVVLVVAWFFRRELVAPWFFARDWQVGAVLAGIIAGYLPWWFTGARTIYSFYTVSFVPWVILAIVVVLAGMGGADPEAKPARMVRWAGFALLGLTVLWFLGYYPLYTAGTVSLDGWEARLPVTSWR